jgi:hypothetical protein
MVHASVHMEYVSMRGWAIGRRSTSDLPLYTSPAGHRPQPDRPCLPYQIRGKGDHQVGSLASPGETSRHLPHQSQVIQDSREKASKQMQKPTWSNHADLPLSGALHRLQGWLSCGVFSPTVLWSTSPSPGLPKQANTNELPGLIRFRLLSHWRRQPRIEVHGQRHPSLRGPMSQRE